MEWTSQRQICLKTAAHKPAEITYIADVSTGADQGCAVGSPPGPGLGPELESSF